MLKTEILAGNNLGIEISGGKVSVKVDGVVIHSVTGDEFEKDIRSTVKAILDCAAPDNQKVHILAMMGVKA